MNYLPRLLSYEKFLRVIDEILDENHPFYTGLDPQLIAEINGATDAFEYQRVEHEQLWRQGLKPGDYIDAIAKTEEPGSGSRVGVAGWCPAKITQVDETSVKV